MDVYSLGVMLYEMVTGEVPVGDFPAAPGGLDRIIRRALAADPARRYPTAAELAGDLRSARSAVIAEPGGQLEPHERIWIRSVATLQSISTAVALWACLVSFTPKVISRGEIMPLVMIGAQELQDGRVLTRARFEMWWTLAALATFGVAITCYGLLRLHWRRAGIERNEPDRRVPESRWVLVWGVVCLGVYLVRKGLEGAGVKGLSEYFPVLGAALEILALFYFWVSILEAWRTSRPLRREPLIWLGFGLALLPPGLQLVSDVHSWQP
jgi:serine/threonine-protein kinase